MTRVLFDDIVMTDYGMFQLVWNRRDILGDGTFDGQENGLVGAADPRGVDMTLAKRHEGSQIRILLLEDPPTDDPRWEDVVEVSVIVPDDAKQVTWMSWAGETSGPLALPPGGYRLRMSARGRDQVRLDLDFVDTYLIELWPSAAAPDRIIRTTTKDAAYWHSTKARR